MIIKFPEVNAVRVSVERWGDMPMSYSVTSFGRFYVDMSGAEWPITVCGMIPDWEGYDKMRRSMRTRCAGSLPVVWPFDSEYIG